MADSFKNRYFNPTRIRSYLFRLPLCTRILIVVMVAFWVGSIALSWLPEWAALVPSEIGITTMHRLNTYPFLHKGILHLLFNASAIIPLLERFESEYGTLVTLLLFTGPFSTLPGGFYTFIERIVLRMNTSVMGASIWVFLLLSFEAMKSYQANPSFTLGPYRIPTWTSPLFLALTVSFLIPQTSLLGHLCGAAVGYGCGMGYIKYLLPPERILRWIEGKLNLLGRLPHYVSVDQKTYGRYGVLPSSAPSASSSSAGPDPPPTLSYKASSQRLGS